MNYTIQNQYTFSYWIVLSLYYTVQVYIFIISFSISVLFSRRTHVDLIDLENAEE